MQEHVGYVKLYRKLLDWEWYDDANTVRVFLHILLNATWQEKKWHGQTLNPGEYCTTVSELSNELKLSNQQTRTALDHLKSTNQITITRSSKTSIISIKNWGEFQSGNNQINKQITIKQQSNQQSDNNQITNSFHYMEEDKEVKNIKKREGGFAAPTLDEVRSYISERGYTFSAERFHSYYCVQGWKRHGRYIEDWKSLADYWQTGEKKKPEERNSSFDVDDLRSFGILSE